MYLASTTMASIWTGVRLQDVKAQLQLRGHQVPDQVILSFLREAATSTYHPPGQAISAGVSTENSEAETTCSETSSELDEAAAGFPFAGASKDTAEPQQPPKALSGNLTASPTQRRNPQTQAQVLTQREFPSANAVCTVFWQEYCNFSLASC